MASPADLAPRGLIAVDRDGETLTGVPTGIPANSFSIRKLSARRQSGWIVQDDTLSEWTPRGLMEHEGQIYVTGPRIDGTFLDRALSDPDRDHLSDLVDVASALNAMVENNTALPSLHTRSMVLLGGGGIFVLPPEIVTAIIEHADVAEQIRIFDLFNHPDRSATENIPFFLSVLVYTALTGGFPYDAPSPEAVHTRIRAARPIAAQHRRYEIRPDISAALNSTLSGESPETSPETWRDRLIQWREEGVLVELSVPERDAIQTQAEAGIQKLDRSFERNEHVRRNWRRWLVIAAIVVAVGSVPATILRNSLRPRATAGLTASEVVEAFYGSISTLNHMVMEDAVVDRAGRALIREVTNLYVIDRQRMAVEFQSSFVDAQSWRDAGMPALDRGESPYGVVDLRLEPLAASEGEAAFMATYERWLPLTPEDPEAPPPQYAFQGFLVTDQIQMRTDRDDWVIYELITVSLEELDIDTLAERPRPIGSAGD